MMDVFLFREVTIGINGINIYQCSNGIFYAVEGRVDCRLDGAEQEVRDRAFLSHRKEEVLCEKIKQQIWGG